MKTKVNMKAMAIASVVLLLMTSVPLMQASGTDGRLIGVEGVAPGASGGSEDDGEGDEVPLAPGSSGPQKREIDQPVEWVFVEFEEAQIDIPTVFNPLDWTVNLFNLNVDATGHASDGDQVTLSILFDTGRLLEFTENIPPGHDDMVLFRDIPANIGAEYKLEIDERVFHFDPFRESPYSDAPLQRNPCTDESINACDLANYGLMCAQDLDCADTDADPCVDAQAGCELVYFAIACMEDPDCPEVTNPCTLVHLPGVCGPLPDPCDLAPFLCNPPPPPPDPCEEVNDVQPVPGTCGNPVDVCDPLSTICLLVVWLEECIEDPDCPDPLDYCQYLDSVPGLCGPVPPPCEVVDDLGGVPGVCGYPLPPDCDGPERNAICDYIDQVVDCSKDPDCPEPIDHCEYLDAAPGLCGNPLPPDCDGPERNAICDYIDQVVDCSKDPDCPEPVDHCEYLDGVPGLCGPVPPPCDVVDDVGGVPGACGEPLPDPCDPLTTLCLLIVWLADCVEDPDCPEPIDHCEYLDGVPGLCGPVPPPCDVLNDRGGVPGTCGKPLPPDCDGQQRNAICDSIDDAIECLNDVDDCLNLDYLEPCNDCNGGGEDDDEDQRWEPPSDPCGRAGCSTMSANSCGGPNQLSDCPHNDILAALDTLLAEVPHDLVQNATLQEVMDSARNRLLHSIGPSCAELVGDLCTQTERAIVDCVFLMECDDLPGMGALCQQSNQTCNLVATLMQSCTFGSDCPGIEELVDAIAEPLHTAIPGDLKLEAINLDEVPRNAEGVIDLIGLEPETTSSSSTPGVEVGRYDGILTSYGDPGDTGTFIKFYINNGEGPGYVSMKFCYIGSTNNEPAFLSTYAISGSDYYYSDLFTFNSPSTGSNTIGASSWRACSASDSSTFQEIVFELGDLPTSMDAVKFDFGNGDDRVAIADIVVTAGKGSPAGSAQGNNPPNKPTLSGGPSGTGELDTTYCFSSRAFDPDWDLLRYEIDWGDGSQVTHRPSQGYTRNNQLVAACHSWNYAATFQVQVTAYDHHGNPSLQRLKEVEIRGENNNPKTPAEPSGYPHTHVGVKKDYRTKTTDPDGDKLRYEFDWGDGTTSWSPAPPSWTSSGTERQAGKSYASSGEYHIRARAHDDHGGVSDWSDSHRVTIYPKWTDCEPVVSHSYAPGSTSEWTNVIQPGAMVNVSAGGFRHQFEYHPDCEPDIQRTASAVFSFGFRTHNWVSGEQVLRFGGIIQGETHRDGSPSPIHHYIQLSGMQFFYAIPESHPQAVPVQGTASFAERAESTCSENWGVSHNGRIALAFAAEFLPGLGTSMAIVDKYCDDPKPKVVTSLNGKAGLGVKELRFASKHESAPQAITGRVNIDYDNVPRREEISLDLTAMHDVSAFISTGGPYYFHEYKDYSQHWFTVNPKVQRSPS